MKKKLFIGSLLISILTISVFVTGCASSPKSSAQMVVTITGIPSRFEGMVGGIVLDTGGSSANVAWSMPTTISGGVNENYMLDWVTDSAWGKDGTYRIIYVIYTDSNLTKETASSFVIASRNLTGNVSISFSQFTSAD